MRTYKERVYYTTKVDTVTCDFCKEVINSGYSSVDECTISRKVGCQYPEGATGELFEVDICGGCFETKLTPWLHSQRVKITETDWDI